MNGYCDCQLKRVYTAAEELNIFDRLWLIFIRLLKAFLRRFEKIRNHVNRNSFMNPSYSLNQLEVSEHTPKTNPLEPGNKVQILSFEEIKKTFMKDNQTQGLVFMSAMKKHCGKKAKVLKRINYILDEKGWKTIKLKNVVILEGLICNGEGMFSKEGCNRCCFFFWKESWLKKI